MEEPKALSDLGKVVLLIGAWQLDSVSRAKFQLPLFGFSAVVWSRLVKEPSVVLLSAHVAYVCACSSFVFLAVRKSPNTCSSSPILECEAEELESEELRPGL